MHFIEDFIFLAKRNFLQSIETVFVSLEEASIYLNVQELIDLWINRSMNITISLNKRVQLTHSAPEKCCVALIVIFLRVGARYMRLAGINRL